MRGRGGGGGGRGRGRSSGQFESPYVVVLHAGFHGTEVVRRHISPTARLRKAVVRFSEGRYF